MNADTIPDPAAACRRVQKEIDRPRWKGEQPIPPCDLLAPLLDALYGWMRPVSGAAVTT